MLKKLTYKINLSVKLIIGYLLVGTIPFAVLAFIALNNSEDTLLQESFSRLTSIREMKAAQIEDYFGSIRKQMLTLSKNEATIEAMKQFSVSFSRVREDNSVFSTSQMRESVLNFYNREFAGEYANKNSGSNIDIQGLVNQLDDDSIALQYYYISNNRNPLGNKHQLQSASDLSTYSRVHAKYHPSIKAFLEEFGFYDIFLVDHKTGDIVYSVYKEVDYSTSLIDGPYSNTNFGQVFKEASAASDPDFVKLVDFEPYLPSYRAPASFIASPIFDGSQKVGVLVFQMPVDVLNNIMTNQKKWQQMGLGQGGETYLVGSDFTMRSQSRDFLENSDSYFNIITAQGVPAERIARIKGKETTILFQNVKTQGTSAAINGKSEVAMFKNYLGTDVISAYRPLKIKDMNWAIMSELPQSEAFTNLRSLEWMIAISFILGVIGIAVAALLSAKAVARPIMGIIDRLHDGSRQVTAAANQVASGSESLANDTTEQAAALEETAASIEEVSAMAKKNSNNAIHASEISSTVHSLSTEGVSSMERMSRAINAIKTAADETSAIIKTIDDIAFQTNLLALNAAVEAARAGDAGKGFAVVAEEVRNLAQRSADAAKETAEKIRRSKELADEGVQVSGEVERSLKEIRESSVKAADLVKEISSASGEQNIGIDSVTRSISELDKSTQNNAASAEESAATGTDLLNQAKNLDTVIDNLAALIYGKKEDPDVYYHDQNAELAAGAALGSAGFQLNSDPNDIGGFDSSQFNMNESIVSLEDNDFQSF